MLQFLFDTLSRTSDLALIALGLSLVYGLAKFPNIAHVQYAMLGAFASVVLQRAGTPLALALGMASLLAGSLAVLCNLWVFSRLRRQGPAIAMIGSLALAMILVAAALAGHGASPLAYRLPLIAPWVLGPLFVAPNQALAMGVTLAVLLACTWLLLGTRQGRAMRALACNPPLAAAAGLDAERIIHAVHFLGAALAGLGGALLALNTGAYVNLGNDLLLPIFAAAILGGLGNPLGAVFGGLLIALAETLVTNLNIGWLYGQPMAFVPAGYIGAASFVILLLALLLRPYGLFDREVRRV
ncbi:branched-chain amino acid ABC transporter permease [Pseudomonas typographi]|uniref:branched-chain amino acid ABC transporter permease n=1 Tax=Pseudomonas typographi TaxID=2715964 RepID=UPI001687C914|nr:branched-chain amino acid ABC transporter permease [Pseudomonas typographi]MBD1552676.1 branched-chain amino acid ABC transporter permease [Pseudomonas typographi]